MDSGFSWGQFKKHSRAQRGWSAHQDDCKRLMSLQTQTQIPQRSGLIHLFHFFFHTCLTCAGFTVIPQVHVLFLFHLVWTKNMPVNSVKMQLFPQYASA